MVLFARKLLISLGYLHFQFHKRGYLFPRRFHVGHGFNIPKGWEYILTFHRVRITETWIPFVLCIDVCSPTLSPPRQKGSIERRVN